MARVLIPGRWTGSLWVGSCSRCGAVVEYRGDEVSNIRRLDGKRFVTENCPACFKEQGVKAYETKVAES